MAVVGSRGVKNPKIDRSLIDDKSVRYTAIELKIGTLTYLETMYNFCFHDFDGKGCLRDVIKQKPLKSSVNFKSKISPFFFNRLS